MKPSKSLLLWYSSTMLEHTSYIIFAISAPNLSPLSAFLRLLYITVRWEFITSSYSSRRLRTPKLFSSTFFWALSIDFDIIECWITSPSLSPILSISLAILSEPNIRIRLSSRETKNCEEPGSPWRPERPLSCLSTRRDSWRSVPIIAKPPACFTLSLSLISVPRPAIFVAIVTLLEYPASATISASRLCSFAFNTLCLIPLRESILLNNSEISTDVVPTSTGRPFFVKSSISLITAAYFSRVVLNTRSL